MRTKPISALTDEDIIMMSFKTLLTYGLDKQDEILARKEVLLGRELRDLAERLWEVIQSPYYTDLNRAEKFKNMAHSLLSDAEIAEETLNNKDVEFIKRNTRKVEKHAIECMQ